MPTHPAVKIAAYSAEEQSVFGKALRTERPPTSVHLKTEIESLETGRYTTLMSDSVFEIASLRFALQWAPTQRPLWQQRPVSH